MPDLFYLQDSRQVVGNDMMWWAWNGHGYTSDLRKAHVYTSEEAMAQHKSRETDIPWPKDYIDSRTRPAVDIQHVERKALRRAGVKLQKPKPIPKTRYNCVGCGRFLTEYQVYAMDCPHCGADNSP